MSIINRKLQYLAEQYKSDVGQRIAALRVEFNQFDPEDSRCQIQHWKTTLKQIKKTLAGGVR